MERTTITTQCDVCGYKVKMSFDKLTRDAGWVQYTYGSSWGCGTHSGVNDVRITVCDTCDNGRQGIKYFFHKFLRPFIKANKPREVQ